MDKDGLSFLSITLSIRCTFICICRMVLDVKFQNQTLGMLTAVTFQDFADLEPKKTDNPFSRLLPLGTGSPTIRLGGVSFVDATSKINWELKHATFLSQGRQPEVCCFPT